MDRRTSVGGCQAHIHPLSHAAHRHLLQERVHEDHNLSVCNGQVILTTGAVPTASTLVCLSGFFFYFQFPIYTGTLARQYLVGLRAYVCWDFKGWLLDIARFLPRAHRGRWLFVLVLVSSKRILTSAHRVVHKCLSSRDGECLACFSIYWAETTHMTRLNLPKLTTTRCLRTRGGCCCLP